MFDYRRDPSKKTSAPRSKIASIAALPTTTWFACNHSRWSRALILVRMSRVVGMLDVCGPPSWPSLLASDAEVRGAQELSARRARRARRWGARRACGWRRGLRSLARATWCAQPRTPTRRRNPSAVPDGGARAGESSSSRRHALCAIGTRHWRQVVRQSGLQRAAVLRQQECDCGDAFE